MVDNLTNVTDVMIDNLTNVTDVMPMIFHFINKIYLIMIKKKKKLGFLNLKVLLPKGFIHLSLKNIFKIKLLL